MSTEIERGESLLADGHEAEAERCFRGLLDRDPRNTEALNNLGVIAYRKNELKEAAAYFEKALAIDPLYRDSVENLKLVTRLTRQAETAAGEAPRLAGARISIVAPFDNKFNELYRRYFSRDNEVRLLRPRSQADLESPMDWSDITFTTWCNEPLVYLSRQPKKSQVGS